MEYVDRFTFLCRLQVKLEAMLLWHSERKEGLLWCVFTFVLCVDFS